MTWSFLGTIMSLGLDSYSLGPSLARTRRHDWDWTLIPWVRQPAWWINIRSTPEIERSEIELSQHRGTFTLLTQSNTTRYLYTNWKWKYECPYIVNWKWEYAARLTNLTTWQSTTRNGGNKKLDLLNYLLTTDRNWRSDPTTCLTGIQTNVTHSFNTVLLWIRSGPTWIHPYYRHNNPEHEYIRNIILHLIRNMNPEHNLGWM